MTFRTRLRLAFLAVVIVPLAGFGFAVRRAMSDRIVQEYRRRVAALVSVIEEDLGQRSEEISAALATLGAGARRDNRFRLAVVAGSMAERPYLLDYAGAAMRLAGLAMLQIQDEGGRIVSSGHFRNDYDRQEAGLPELLAKSPGGAAIVEVRTASEPFLALARLDTLRLGDRRFWIVGGISIDPGLLSKLGLGEEFDVSLVYPGGRLGARGSGAQGTGDPAPSDAGSSQPAASVVGELDFPFLGLERREIEGARFMVTRPLDELRALLRDLDRWLAVALAATLVLALIVANWIASRVSRPLAELARKTMRVDLDRLDVAFGTGKDEIGKLSSVLGAMTDRLRTSATRLREAERRATIGDLARQVNHDIRNGLAPIRNVLRHLSEVAAGRPSEMATVFREREGTLESSVAYLENLATNYARLSPVVERRDVDVNAIAGEVMTSLRTRPDVALHFHPDPGVTTISGDPVAFRRIIENLVENAIDSIGPGPGHVELTTSVTGEAIGQRQIRIEVSDDGSGISAEQRARIFDDFYTSKTGGTGLGLSIVRRLVMDLNGSIEVESEPGVGSRFVIEVPVDDGPPSDPHVNRRAGRAEG